MIYCRVYRIQPKPTRVWWRIETEDGKILRNHIGDEHAAIEICNMLNTIHDITEQLDQANPAVEKLNKLLEPEV